MEHTTFILARGLYFMQIAKLTTLTKSTLIDFAHLTWISPNVICVLINKTEFQLEILRNLTGMKKTLFCRHRKGKAHNIRTFNTFVAIVSITRTSWCSFETNIDTVS